LLATVLGAALAGAAAPVASNAPLVVTHPAPPLAPAAPSGNFTPAPMPNLDLDGSTFRKTGPAGVVVTPMLFRERQPTVGDGYTPNSTIDGEQTKRFRPMPGLNLNVPLP
jgi:hypothetical protein